MNVPKFIFRLLLGRRLPLTTGTLEVSGINQPVLIRRDGYGISYIEAKGDEDAWYGLGFCHGQDRAFQLEGLVRVVRGTLAELVGPAALPVDRLSRRIGFCHAAEQQSEALDDGIRQMLEAYAQGVTDGAKVGCRQLAHEFALLRTQPTPYCAADVLGVLKLMSFNLASNWDSELARLKILTEDGPEALEALDPAYPAWLPVTSPPTALAGSTVDRLAEDLAVFRATVGQGGGSNNWAIAPSRTATGRAILANDPHLAPVLPPYWYLAHVRTPDWAVAGASFVGAPTFPAGHNGTAAWGITAGLLDNTDLFIEEIGPDGRSVREGDQFVPCETRLETIHVKGGETVEEEVLVTPRGPIIGPALEGEVGAISLRATWLDPRPVNGLLQIHRARSFEEFRRAFEQWPALPLNMAYADTSGTVGWQLVGEAPQRQKGWGTIPLPGWDPKVGWEDDPIPFDEMPHLADPEIGFVATANNQPTPEGDGPFLGTDWIDGYRLARIVEALEARHDWDLVSVQALQMDQKSLPWRDLRDIVLAVPADTDEARQALAMMEAWDGVLTAGSPAAAIFEFFVAQMARRIAEAKAPRAAQWALGKGFTPLVPHSMFSARRVGHLVRLVREQPEGWFERPWPQEMADALATVIRTLREQYGNDPNQWAWGRVRPLTLCHSVGERAPLDQVFNLGPFAWGGDASTVSQAATDPADPTANPYFIASLLMVVDVGNWDENRFALPGGQSGNPLSPHYDDQLALWQRGEGVSIAWSATKVEQATRSMLRLMPR
ncbi:MAG: penicillin acylase family protein [Fidelibacterota bacterium]|nr:MAG: penicillin acylase family protein [Candidatus Neomarinimicrobiota bacterium]